MLAGTVGLGVAPLAAIIPDGPALIMRPSGQRAAGCVTWVNHSLRDMNPLLVRGSGGRLPNDWAAAALRSGKVGT
jgi:hypothetical protein